MSRRIAAKANSAAKAIVTRRKASQKGPSAGTATRMKANEPPQSPASRRSRAMSRRGTASVARERGDRFHAGRDLERELARDRRMRALVREQPLLAPEPAAIARQRSVRADHAMAGDDDAQTVVAI